MRDLRSSKRAVYAGRDSTKEAADGLVQGIYLSKDDLSNSRHFDCRGCSQWLDRIQYECSG
jgi:hypothetical protein